MSIGAEKGDSQGASLQPRMTGGQQLLQLGFQTSVPPAQRWSDSIGKMAGEDWTASAADSNEWLFLEEGYAAKLA